MIVRCFWEHNGNDTLLYAMDHPGAYTRGESLSAAAAKMSGEIACYLKWRGEPVPGAVSMEIIGEKASDLEIRDADSDALFPEETAPLTPEEYQVLKALVLRSAADFLSLYRSIDRKDTAISPIRRTFYGQVPRTAEEMYVHTKNVNAYYFAEIDVDADNEGDILQCRQRGFGALEKKTDFLQNPVIEGSYGENWTLRKVLRRFLWHDRIHAKAMYRMAVRLFGTAQVKNPFCFE